MLIRREALEFILGVSRNYYPDEFGGMLRGEKDTITEALVIPASTYGDGFVETRHDMIPIDHTVIGSFHSHPGPDFRPSRADLASFERKGTVHLILRHPYRTIEDVAAYDRKGKRVELRIK